jgi:hypothetical protein
MQTDILLKQIHERIGQLEEKIRDFRAALKPDSTQADSLNDEAQKLVRLLGAYTFISQQHELSPRLDLHLKVAEKIQDIPVAEKKQEPVQPEIKPPVQPEVKADIRPEPVKEPVQQTIVLETPVKPASTTSPLQIGINDKFRFINELFKSNAVEYGIAVEQINAITNWNDTLVYLNGLKNIYSWQEDHEMVKKLFELSKKRFA